MADEQAQVQPDTAVAAGTTEAQPSLLDQIIHETRIGRDEQQAEQSRREIATLIQAVLSQTVKVSKDLERTLSATIADIDQLISGQLNEIMHHPDLQKLEASWRGLRFLVMSSETSTMLKIKVMNVSKKDLARDLERATEFDQSALFKKVYEEEFGMFGG